MPSVSRLRSSTLAGVLQDTQLTLKRPEERTVVLQKPGRTFFLPAGAVAIRWQFGMAGI